MWEILFNLLKSDEAQIVAILLLYVALAYIARMIWLLKNNHFVHTDAAIEVLRREIREDLQQIRNDIRSLNEGLRG